MAGRLGKFGFMTGPVELSTVMPCLNEAGIIVPASAQAGSI